MARILNEEQQLIRQAVRSFAQNEVRPAFQKHDRENSFPMELHRRCGELGFLGADVPEECGGAELSLASSLMILEEVSKEMPALGCSLMVSMTVPLFLYCDSNPEHNKLIPELISGEKVGAMAETDPAGVLNITEWPVLGVKDGKDYILNGTKLFVTNAQAADYMVVSGMVGGKPRRFLLKKGMPGLDCGHADMKMGMNGAGNGTIVMHDVRVPASDEVIMNKMTNNLAAGYLHISSVALGCMEGAYEKTREYLNVRTNAGKPIIQMQAAAHEMAQIKTKIEACRSFIDDAAALVAAGKPDSTLIRMVKVFVTDTAVECTRQCIQLYGGLGYCEETGIAHYMRDAVGATIGDLTAPIQTDYIAKALAKLDAKNKKFY